MDLQQKLKEQGWHISNDGLSKLPADVDKSDTRKVVQSLLDIDLRDVGAGALPAEISRKEESIPGRIVLQIVKIRNISAPKSNEESKTAPRFLYVEFTDGAVQIFGLEFEYISSISLNTPPGTKIFMKTEKMPLMQGILVLRPSEMQVLGGEVTALVEKWELTRTLQKYARGGRINTGSSGPPPWIPFGQKIQQFNDDKNFKSLVAGNGPEKEKDPKENEFDAMRNEAIAEAAKSGAKKIFGGGNQQMLDHNVKKIIEKGFSEIDAKNALRATRNNLERALYNLKRRDDVRERPDSKDIVRGAPKRGVFKETKKIGGKEDQIAASAKPAGNVSLFDFLTDKLPANSETTACTDATNTTSSSNKFDRPPSKFDSSRPGNASFNQQHQSSGYQSQSSIPGNQHSSSTMSTSQQQSSRPTKFENNISSSFANRNTTNSFDGSDFNNYRNRNRTDRNDRNERSSRGGGSSYSARQPSELGRGGGHSQRNSIRPSQERERGSNFQQSGVNAEYRDSRMEGQRGGSDNKSYKTQSSATRYSNKPNYSNNFPQNNSSNYRNYSDNRSTPHTDSEKMMEVIEDTARMKLEGRPSTRGGGASRLQRSHSSAQQQSNQKHPQQHQQSIVQQQQQSGQATSQSQQQQQLQQQHAVYTPLPNGFAYDPNKILGFQNKESNEYALSMLKSQSLPPAGSTMPTPPNAHAQYSQGAPPMQIAPQQSFHPAPPQFLMQAPPTVRTFGIPTMDGGFNWKIGDRCLAKYWEDGRYYEAEITGLSDETCVVLFLGYGNYEEVLKSDCLPNSNHPIVQHHHQAGVPPQQLQHPLHQQTSARAGTTAGVASTGRYRGERQMYVPPPKREA